MVVYTMLWPNREKKSEKQKFDSQQMNSVFVDCETAGSTFKFQSVVVV